MIHERHFSAEEANRLLPEIEPSLRALRDARDRLTDAELLYRRIKAAAGAPALAI